MKTNGAEGPDLQHTGTKAPAGGCEATRPLHVVFLADTLGFPNGMAATSRVRLEARAMAAAGARPHVLCMQASERPPVIENTAARGEWNGVTFEYACGTTLRHSSFLMRRVMELHGWIAGIRRLVELRRAGRLDCVYLWFTCQRLQVRRVIFAGVLRLLRVPVVMELNERPWSLRTDQTAAERATSPLTGMAGAVSISAYLTRWARKEAEERRLKFLVAEIPILVDMAEQPSPRPLPDGAPMLVFAGAPQYDETIDFILNAMEHVWRDHPTCRLAITGARAGDPAAEALTSRIAGDVGDDGRVLFAGYLPRPELLALYQDATALLIPLFDDVRSLARFPTKTGEYLASGRPVVTTGVGEMARAFTDGEDAVVAPAGDPGEYGRRICALLADRESASRIGSAGREYARAHFDYGLHGASLVQAFSEVGSVAFSPRGTSLRAGVRGAAGAVHAARRRRPGGRRGPR